MTINKIKARGAVELVDLFASIGAFHYSVAAVLQQFVVRPFLVSEILALHHEIDW